jgi:hypothetical protein
MQFILAHSPRNPTILSGGQSLNGEPRSHGRGSAGPGNTIWQSISIFSIKFKFSLVKLTSYPPSLGARFRPCPLFLSPAASMHRDNRVGAACPVPVALCSRRAVRPSNGLDVDACPSPVRVVMMVRVSLMGLVAQDHFFRRILSIVFPCASSSISLSK